MIRMVTTATHQYAGHRLHAGEEYDCEEQHVELMLKLGWAKRVEQPQTYQTRVMVAESPRRARSRRK